MARRIISLCLLIAVSLSLCRCVHTPASTETAPSPEISTAPETASAPATESTATEPTAETEPPVEAAFTPMGEIRITADGAITSDYADVQLRASWTGGEAAQQTVRIKLRGNSSKLAAKKSYNIKFDEKISFMGMEPGKKWSLLANPFDKSLLRIVLGFDYAAALGIPYASQTRLCKLWLNDEYMGIYVAIEPADVGKGRIEIDPDAGDFLIERNCERAETGIRYFETDAQRRFEINEPEDASDVQAEQIRAAVNRVEAAVKTLDHTQYEKYLDIDSFVNCYIFQEVIKDVDFGQYSNRYYMYNGVLYAGPPWDLDLSMGNVSGVRDDYKYHRYYNQPGLDQGNGSSDSTQAMWAQKDFYRWLCLDSYFMDLVRERWQAVRALTWNLVQENELGLSRMDRYLQAHEADLLSNFSPDGAGWSITQVSEGEYHAPAADYLGNVELLRQWLQQRIAWLDARFGAENVS